MKKIIVLYPKEFNCYEKFFRKVSRIISNMGSVSLVFPEDPNGFIVKFSRDNRLGGELIKTPHWESEEITHGVIFDDGEVFPGAVSQLHKKQVPLRIIKIKITRVINIKRDSDKPFMNSKNGKYEYIGRGSYWGNPYSMYENGDSREEVIRKFKYDFDYEKFLNKDKSEVYKLAGKRLGCFCKPKVCHGDILADFLNSWDDGK